MSGPEHLETGPAPVRRGARWLVLGAVVAVVAGLAVVRVAGPGQAPAPPPSPPVSTSAPVGRSWPVGAGIPSGTLYVAAAGRVQSIDVGSGLLTRTRVEIEPDSGSMTPFAAGVLVDQGDEGPNQVLVLGDAALRVPRALRSTNTFLPGADFAVWAATIDAREPPETNRWRQLDEDGRATATVEVTGAALADGAGGLLAAGAGRFRQVSPGPAGPWQAGAVVAVGPDGYVVRPCGGCPDALQDRAGHPRTDLAVALPGAAYGARLSPGNRFLALTARGDDDDVAQVSEVGSGRLLRTFPGAGADAHATAWLDDRWLVLVSQDQLTLYDAVEDRVVTPALPLSSLGPLVWQPT